MQAFLVTFASTHAAMAFEDSFRGEGALVPVPPAVRAGCGMAWRFPAANEEEAYEKAATSAQSAGLSATDWELHPLSPPVNP